MRYMENPCKIICFGDSITKGYVPFFRKKILCKYCGRDIEITDEGHVGETSSDALLRLDGVAGSGADIVIVGFGMNDWRKGVSLDKFRENISHVVCVLQKSDIRVILNTVNPDFQGILKGTSKVIDLYNDVIRDIARDSHICIADINSAWVRKIRPASRGLADSLHPNCTSSNQMREFNPVF